MFISYAQNYEDVMLWRALKQIDHGFYIDVGANDPVLDSVTEAFYQQGWQGINIEPVSLYYERLCEARPRDINLQVVVTDREEEVILYEIPQTGLSTIDEEIAGVQKSAGWQIVERKIQSCTLNQILEKHVKRPIHFLKIDVEGAEEKAVRGLDLVKWRPWILIIESTMPSSKEENFIAWEPMIIDANYEMVYFDGLNRYYIADEHSELKKYFNTPPNVFDNFAHRADGFWINRYENLVIETERLRTNRDAIQAQLDEMIKVQEINREVYQARLDELTKMQELNHETYQAKLDELTKTEETYQVKIDEITTKLEDSQIKLYSFQMNLENVTRDRDDSQYRLSEVISEGDNLRAQLNAVTTQRDKIFEELNEVYHSRSFRITRPLRYLFIALRFIKEKIKNFIQYIVNPFTKGKSGKPSIKKTIRKYLRVMYLNLEKFPKLQSFLLRVINKFPHLKLKIKNAINEEIEIKMPQGTIDGEKELFHMNEDVSRIYRDLVSRINTDNIIVDNEGLHEDHN